MNRHPSADPAKAAGTESRPPRVGFFPTVHARWRQQVESLTRREINEILARTAPPRTTRSEGDFEKLQRGGTPLLPPPPDRSPYATWKRAVDRANHLLDITGLKQPGARVLHAGCLDGLVGQVLASFGHDVTLADGSDARDVRSLGLRFAQRDLQAMVESPAGGQSAAKAVSPASMIDPESFDLAFTYDTFTHTPDPAAALRQLVRTARPGGFVYVEFGPLYPSPNGMQCSHILRMAYPQFLFSRPFAQWKVRELSPASDSDPSGAVARWLSVNQWRLSQLVPLFETCGCHVISKRQQTSWEYLQTVRDYPEAFSGRGLTFDDVTTTTLGVLMRKKG